MTAAPSGPRHSRRTAAALAVVTSPLGVLLVERRDRRPPWSFPGGHIEPGETATVAAVRETLEETGLVVVAGAVLGERTHPTTGRHLVYVAAIPRDTTEVRLADPAALAAVRWVPVPEVVRLLPGLHPPVGAHLRDAGRPKWGR